jgi:RecB family endonuclease NucS
MRDAYADELDRYRPHEVEVSRERLPGATDQKRADLFTVDRHGLLRIWEFKVRATAASVGQLLVYLALCRRHYAGKRVVRPVLAAAEFDPDVTFAIEALNLGVEVVVLPPAVLNAGRIPFSRPSEPIPAFTLK